MKEIWNKLYDSWYHYRVVMKKSRIRALYRTLYYEILHKDPGY